ncbi:hypothetical protein [Tichowtungia aerotolerans]|uniref:Uncharacterized protein n=1 Tax=Tichowtungia aerotolerans TaxID=2697043 RepID=A0A6P1M1N5_9BACT|nr:hypothetical protein [Tichowtungia aerotolerans]QHI68729.1 hypothetical protein GT409_04455 [Tichowtungia aerotolerans]
MEYATSLKTKGRSSRFNHKVYAGKNMTDSRTDVAYSAFTKTMPELKRLSENANEAATRLRAIDTILFDILDWEKEDVEPERYCRAEGYADYVCIAEGQPLLVIEAKRIGKTFALETDTLENRPYSFGFIASESKEAADALQQAIGYAATLGAHYVAITNGRQWLLTLTYVDGKALLDRLVYIFESFDAIKERFRLFCQCFSKSHLTRHEIHGALLDILLKPAPSKASARIPGHPQPAERNIFQNELSYVLDYVWQVMSQDEGSSDFVNNCYVSPENHKDTIALVKELIAKRTAEDAILTQHDIKSIDNLPQQLAHLPTEKPFVILGQVGRGKTSFLKYLRHVAASELLTGFIQLDVNFIDRPDDSSQIPTYVYDEIERQLLELYKIDIREDRFVRGVLHFELKRLKNTPRGKAICENTERYKEYELDEIDKILEDRHAYLTRVFHHLKKGRNCSVAIFVDNLDRRETEIQEQAFLRASAMARDWASLTFVCLRPETFHRSREGGVLDAIAPTAFTVAHPDLALVLKRRFAYAKSIASGERLTSGTVDGYNPNIRVKLPDVAALLGSCEFAARRRHGIIPVLEAVSNGNIRRMLDFARSVLCSGHLDTKKILGIIQTDGNYTIPDFEGVKALLYGEYKHYYGIESPFINLFDVIHAQQAEHFLALCVLHFLSRNSEDGPSRGFTARSDLTSYLSGVGFSLQACEQVLQRLGAKQLITPEILSADEVRDRRRFRLTSLGAFHLHYLCRVFQYLDAMTLDTPIIKQEVRACMADTTSIHERVSRTKEFLTYLDNALDDINDDAFTTFWRERSSEARDEISEVETRIGPA